MASSAHMNPYDNYESTRISADIIDPDDLDINDLDDPLDNPTTPLNPSALTSAIPGEDRRAPTNTLDESVWDTLSRDILAVWAKMKAVLYPKFTFRRWPDANDVLESGGSSGSGRVLGEWDLWGPLVFCLALSTLLSVAAGAEQKTQVFAGVFAMVWVGEAVVTAQIKLLGGNISFFSSVSIIGYTLFPVVICALLSALHVPSVVRVPVYAACFLWSLAAGVSILGGSGVVRNRVGLAVFPLGVFYGGLVCLCLVS
ncbi:uncharacterized protein LAJ45_04915 [Morchella importuna]|uniref:Protein YIP n=1 Tax=Morchella conica CCBAS932 TaxID=1392247 RepID=A0A3N4KQI1_9PEZI|nr:uncharacterized protein LAJ45_04915 [Morchella importuna]KAH8151213.1 hypothetical protein LAJ45_04915 [Morchella importuna]RPB08015.1 Yip1-domain-containing protein [Morchella conica CCBAS932]